MRPGTFTLKHLLPLLPFRRGDTRCVFLVPPLVVIKWPRPRNRREGISSNLLEREWSRRGFDELSPVIASNKRGWFVVMRWARPLRDAEWEEFSRWDENTFMAPCIRFCLQRHPAIPVEAGRRSSYGVFQGRIVAVDYGTPS
jgi:hypothetical protein